MVIPSAKKQLFCGGVSHFWKVIVTRDSFMLCILFYFLCCDSQWSVSLKGGFLTSYPEKVPPMFNVFHPQISSISIRCILKKSRGASSRALCTFRPPRQPGKLDFNEAIMFIKSKRCELHRAADSQMSLSALWDQK